MATIEELESKFDEIKNTCGTFMGGSVESLANGYDILMDGSFDLATLKKIVALADEYITLRDGLV